MSNLISKLGNGHLYKLKGHLCKMCDIILRPAEYLACQFGGYQNGYCSSGFVYNSGMGGSYSGNYQAASQLRSAISGSVESTTYTWQYGNYEPKFAMMCGSLGMGLGGGVDPVRSDGSWAMYPAKRFQVPASINPDRISRATVIIKGAANYYRACNNCVYGNCYAFADWMNNNSVSGLYVWSSGGDGWRRQSIMVHTYGAVGEYYPRYSHYYDYQTYEYGKYYKDGRERYGWHWEDHTSVMEDWLSGGNALDPAYARTVKAYAFLASDQNTYHSRALAKGGVQAVHQTFGGGYDYYPYISGASWYDSSDGVMYGYDLDDEDMARLKNGNLWVTVCAANSLDKLFVSGNNIPGSGAQQIVTIDDYKIKLEMS